MPAVEIQEVADKYGLQPKGRPSRGWISYSCPRNAKHELGINPTKAQWHCFHECTGCPCNAGGSYKLWCMLLGKTPGKWPDDDYKSNHAAFVREFQDNEARQDIIEKITELREQEPEESPKAANDVCDKTYRNLLDMCVLTDAHRADLEKRGLTSEQIEHFGFKSVPQIALVRMCSALLAKGCILQGVPGFFKNPANHWTFASGGSGYFIPYSSPEGHIIGMQIRYDVDISGLEGKALKDAKQRRYRWLSSAGLPNGTAMRSVPYLGEKRDNAKAVYITEGGLKAMVSASIADRWFAAIPGINTYSVFQSLLEYLKSEGVKTIVDAWDTDRKENESVNNSIKKLRQMALDAGFKVSDWPYFMKSSQKGCDDYLLERKQKKAAREK